MSWPILDVHFDGHFHSQRFILNVLQGSREHIVKIALPLWLELKEVMLLDPVWPYSACCTV